MLRRVTERRLSSVPKWIWIGLVITFSMQIACGTSQPDSRADAGDLPQPPSAALARLSALGEPVATAKVLMLWLQAFDFQAGSRVPYRMLDYHLLEGWLGRILELDPAGQYPLMSAARLYAEVPEVEKKRRMVEFVFREYQKDPNRRWPWAAHVAIIAKHQLHDRDLAFTIARALQEKTTAADVPAWVRTMESFASEDLDELESTRILIGGLLASGQLMSERERKLLESRLNDIEERLRKLR